MPQRLARVGFVHAVVVDRTSVHRHQSVEGDGHPRDRVEHVVRDRHAGGRAAVARSRADQRLVRRTISRGIGEAESVDGDVRGADSDRLVRAGRPRCSPRRVRPALGSTGSAESFGDTPALGPSKRERLADHHGRSDRVGARRDVHGAAGRRRRRRPPGCGRRLPVWAPSAVTLTAAVAALEAESRRTACRCRSRGTACSRCWPTRGRRCRAGRRARVAVPPKATGICAA